MTSPKPVLSIIAAQAALRTVSSILPSALAAPLSKRQKRPLGDVFGLKNFGVNLTRVAPGGISAYLHKHTHQDEFVYILEGEAVLVTENEEVLLPAGTCAGFPAGGEAHQLVNRSDRDLVYLEIGDRTAGDAVTYPNDDLKASPRPEGGYIFTRKDGTEF